VSTKEDAASKAPHVGLYVTCLVDFFRPSVGFAAIKLLEEAGAKVSVPEGQTCCGQPAYNSGDPTDAAAIARQVIDLFEGFDYVVAPSGSCAGMLKRHYPQLLADDPVYRAKADGLAAKTYELVSFLTDVMGMERVKSRFPSRVAYHDSCSALRELGIAAQPRKLLESVEGLELVKLEDSEVCCGFGGAFSVKFPAVSAAIADGKIRSVEASGAPCLLSGDLGCLLHLAGRLAREGKKIEVRHVAEVLADMTDTVPIASGR